MKEKSCGFTFDWAEGFRIRTKLFDNAFIIEANEQGLISLANHLTKLASPNTVNQYHLHLDDSNSLEDGSVELIIERNEGL
ncbi:MAG: hypothetical protein BGO76_02295 [Caedibacter sp. 38-128]|nr:hypothetical protein [Holosporales bacterium]OJX08567.1 MAG: hypothetical protein BGO76_02295 [Caedibacter sp. 38-128]